MDEKRYRARLELKADDQTGSFRAVFATLNVIDLDGDVTTPGAFRDGQEVRIARWGHNWFDLPVGKGVIHADEQQAWVDGQFFLDTTVGKDTYLTVKNLGQLQEWSYGFDVTKWSQGQFNGEDVRFLEGLNVHEVSPVMLGAGIGTHTEAIKTAKEGRRNSASDQEIIQQMHDMSLQLGADCPMPKANTQEPAGAKVEEPVQKRSHETLAAQVALLLIEQGTS